MCSQILARLENWAQWFLNPVAAVVKKASQGVSNRAS
jgi:hypothetical protein